MTVWASDGCHTSLSKLKMFVTGMMRLFCLMPLMQKHIHQAWGLPVWKTWFLLSLLRARSWKPCEIFANDISMGRDTSSLGGGTIFSSCILCNFRDHQLASAMGSQWGGVADGQHWWSWRRNTLQREGGGGPGMSRVRVKTVMAERNLLKGEEGTEFRYL